MEKNKVMVALFALLIFSSPVFAIYVGEFTGGNYATGDTVLYNGLCYAAVGTLSNIPATYHPQSQWSHFWTQVDMSNCQEDENTDWLPNTNYNAGDIILYNGIEYVVRASHRSHSTWLPSDTLALYKPHVDQTEVVYLPEEYDYSIDYFLAMPRDVLIGFMDFSFEGSNMANTGINYVWSYLHPQLRNNNIQWVINQYSVQLSFDLVNQCLAEYSMNECISGLVHGTSVIELNNETITSIKELGFNMAVNRLNHALALQEELDSSHLSSEFLNQTIGFAVE